jgi:uncharacterized membrane protein YeaQ/YmgE (transglycosylase-associated protein family)
VKAWAVLPSAGTAVAPQSLASPFTAMNIVLWFLVGAALGWLMSRVLSEPGHEGTMVNLTVGLVSATLAGWFFSPWLRSEGGAAVGRVDLPALVLAIVGALVGLTLFNLLRQAMLRR